MMPTVTSGRHAGEFTNEALPAEHEQPPVASGAPGGVHFELQELSGGAADAHTRRSNGHRAVRSSLESAWHASVDLDDPMSFLRQGLSGRAAGRDQEAGQPKDAEKSNEGVRRLVPVRRRPAEQFVSALIFAAFVAVAAVVGVICVSSLDAAYQDERNTEDLLHDARKFVPAKPGGTLSVDSFEDVQQPARGQGMGPELNRLYKESAQHSWAGHDFDVAFVTGDGHKSQKSAITSGRLQQLVGAPRPAHGIEAKMPVHHVHGKRVWGWLHKASKPKGSYESSAAIQESLDKQADYIIGYPGLDDSAPARTERLVQSPHSSPRVGPVFKMPAMPAMHKTQTLGKLPLLGGSTHAKQVENAEKAVDRVNSLMKQASGNVPVLAKPGNSEQTFKGSDLDDSPVVTAFPHPNGVPEPVRAKSVAVVPYSLTAAPPAHVPFDWVKKYGLLRKSEPVPALPDIRPRAVKFADHAVHERIAHKAAQAAESIIESGERGRACLQEGHGTEPCLLSDYHPEKNPNGVENWKGAPNRPGDQPVSGDQEHRTINQGGTSEQGSTPGDGGEAGGGGSKDNGGSGSGKGTGGGGEGDNLVWPEGGEGNGGETGGGEDVGGNARNDGGGGGENDVNDPLTWPAPSNNDDGTGVDNSGGGGSDEKVPLHVVHEPFTGTTSDQDGKGGDESGDVNDVPPAVPDSGGAEGSGSSPAPSSHSTEAPPAPPPPPISVKSDAITAEVDRLENVVGKLASIVSKVTGINPSQNVYITNNYNNVTVQNANVTKVKAITKVENAVSGRYPPASAPITVVEKPKILPYPEIWPNGGAYANQVVVHVDEDVKGSSLYFSTNVSGTQGLPQEYTEPFVLGPGWTKVEAVAIMAGYNASAIKEAVFRVLACNDDKCCNWYVVYLRFEAVLGGLLGRKEAIPKKQVKIQSDKDDDEAKWLSDESKYQDAKIKKKSADSGAEYARSFERKWGFAFSKSKADLEEMEKKVTKKLRQLLDERELIMDILAKLDSNKLSASTAMGMLQQSLAECAVCKSWRALAQSPLGDAAATTFVLASKLGGSKEVKEVKAILQEILDDLNARRALYEKMLSGARLQVLENEKKLNYWTEEVARMTAEEYEDNKNIDEYGKKAQQVAGQVEVDKQKMERDSEFMAEDVDNLDRHISAIRRILKRIRIALKDCPGNSEIGLPAGSPEERYPAIDSDESKDAKGSKGKKVMSASSQEDDSKNKK